MRRNLGGRELVFILLIFGVLAAAAGYAAYAESRVAALQAASNTAAKDAAEARSATEARLRNVEGQLAKAEAQLRSRPAASDLTVVAKNSLTITGNGYLEGCVRYRAFDKTEETCVKAPVTPDGLPRGVSGADVNSLMACYFEAQLGSPLPRSCR